MSSRSSTTPPAKSKSSKGSSQRRRSSVQTLEQARAALLAFGILPPPEPVGKPMSEARHYRAWCNLCHGNTLHKLDGYDARLLVCIKCALNERVSTTVLQEEPMSLEQALQENTAAVKALTEAIGKAGGIAVGVADKKADAPKADAPKALDYEKEVKPPFLALVKTHGRDFALGKLKETFGFENLKEAADAKHADKYPDIVAKIGAWAKEKSPLKNDDLA